MSPREPVRLEGRDIVCFANDWAGDPLSKKHIMTRLAQKNRVLWVDSLGNRAPKATPRDLGRIVKKLSGFAGGLRRVAENIHVLSPVAVPNYQSRLARALNEWVVGATVRGAMRRLGFDRPLLYSFVPASAWVADALGAERIVYHCVDEYSAFAGAGPEIAALEAELIRASDLVITCSTPLLESKSRLHARTVLVRHGVEHAHFAKALLPETPVPRELQSLPRPIFGFYGLVAEWVDLEAMARVAEAFPGGSVVIVGEVHDAARPQLPRLQLLPNVHFFGRRPYAELPGWCKGFDVALVPFTNTTLTANANPLKLREYLAAGLPVVSSDLPEARALAARIGPGLELAATTDDVVAACHRALEAGAGPDPARSAAMKSESWDDKVIEIETHLLALDARGQHHPTPGHRDQQAKEQGR